MPLAETILSVELDANAREELQGKMQSMHDSLDEMIQAEDEIGLILAASEYSWDELLDEETDWKEYDESVR